MIKQKNIIYGLDSLRFVLAFVVLLSHYPNEIGEYLKNRPDLIIHLLGLIIKISFCGVGSVIAFFIISGFVIHLPYTENFRNPEKYFIRRYIRILGPLIVITLITIKLHCYGCIPVWSLYCELIYYTLYPLMYKIVNGKWKRICIVTFFLSYIIILFFANSDINSLIHQKNINYDGSYWQFGSFATWIIGLPCWLLGVYLADNLRKKKEFAKVSFLKIMVIRTSIFFISIIFVNLKFHYYFSYIFSMNIFAIPLFYWIREEICYYKNTDPVLFVEFLGKFSYSIYLCHAVILYIIMSYFKVTLYNYFIVILLGLFVSYLFYLAIEKPSHKLAVYLSNKFN